MDVLLSLLSLLVPEAQPDHTPVREGFTGSGNVKGVGEGTRDSVLSQLSVSPLFSLFNFNF